MSQQGFDLYVSEPPQVLSGSVQAIWSASVLCSEPVVKPLYADACSGVIFNLGSDITVENKVLPKGVILLPVKTLAGDIVLPPGAKLAGIRFHPAMGLGLLGQHYQSPTLLTVSEKPLFNFQQIEVELGNLHDNQKRVQRLCQWSLKNLVSKSVIPASLEQALADIAQADSLDKLNFNSNVSQRQIEREFKHWLTITPKYYQRVLRIKRAISYLREHQGAKLVDVAHAFGFSDQAHMTREFRSIARKTPKHI